jgi:hypothetical protein
LGIGNKDSVSKPTLAAQESTAELIAKPMNGGNVLGMAGIAFQLLSELCDMYVDCSGIHSSGEFPDFIEQFVP